jgi:lipopolysaccharide transport system permease protein
MSSTLTQAPESPVFVTDAARPSTGGPHPATAAEQVTRIEPGRGFRLKDLTDLWRYRELLYFLAWRDIAIRYKQTVLGVGWAFLQPLTTMLVFAVFLGRLGGLNAGIEHYSLFVFAGVLPWTFFANAVTTAGFSIVQNERLITKIYFPRLLVPLAAIGAPLFDLAISTILLAGMMAWYGVVPSLTILAVPLLLLMLFAAAVGVGCFLSALIVAQRDFKFVLNFGVQLWMFATPSIYLSSASIGPTAQRWLPLNPAHGLILNLRQALLGGPLDWYALLVSSAVSVVLFIVGLVYFRRIERSFADVI